MNRISFMDFFVTHRLRTRRCVQRKYTNYFSPCYRVFDIGNLDNTKTVGGLFAVGLDAQGNELKFQVKP